MTAADSGKPDADGDQTADPLPRRFVAREEFAAASRDSPAIDLEAFRADQEAAVDHWTSDVYDRK